MVVKEGRSETKGLPADGERLVVDHAVWMTTELDMHRRPFQRLVSIILHGPSRDGSLGLVGPKIRHDLDPSRMESGRACVKQFTSSLLVNTFMKRRARL